MVKSLRKGKDFERKVAQILSKNTRVEWKRVPMSGAYSTREKTRDPRFRGDVFTEDPYYQNVVVECKATKNPIDIYELFFARNSRILNWLWQTVEEAGPFYWVLVFKWNRSKIFALSRYHLLLMDLGVKQVKPLHLGNVVLYLGILEEVDENGDGKDA